MAATEEFVGGDGSTGQVGDFLDPNFIAYNTVHPEITISAPGDLFYDIAESAPSLATYVGWIVAKTEIMARRSIEEWHAGLYVRKTLWVRAQ
jgi:hypothetical protein